MNMPTMNPRITFTVSDDMMKRIDEYRFDNRIKNQTQAIVALINSGLEALDDGTEQMNTLPYEDERVLVLFHNADPVYRSVALKILEDNQIQEKERRA